MNLFFGTQRITFWRLLKARCMGFVLVSESPD